MIVAVGSGFTVNGIGPLTIVNPFESVTPTLSRKTPVAEGVHDKDALFVETHPVGSPEMEYDNVPLPPDAVASVEMLCPRSMLLGEIMKRDIEGSA